MADEAVRAYEGTQAQAEVLCTMLNARGIPAKVTFDHEVEGGTAMVEAIIFVPPEQLEDAQALIADVLSGAAERKG